MVCTAVTTICGVWLAYGEPPNLIMKANLYPQLGNAFFLRYCAPAAIASYLRRRLGAARQASGPARRSREHGRHRRERRRRAVSAGVAPRRSHDASRIDRRPRTGSWTAARRRSSSGCARGESLGLAMIRADVPSRRVALLLGHFVSEELADGLDRHYVLDNAGQLRGGVLRPNWPSTPCSRRWRNSGGGRRRSAPSRWCRSSVCWSSTVSITTCRCFWRRSPGFLAALPAIAGIPKMRALAHPRGAAGIRGILLSVSAVPVDYAADARGLLRLHARPHSATASTRSGTRTVAFAQFLGSTFLSAILDNNVVADFASRGAARPRHRRPASLRDGADRRLCARRLLDAHRLCTVGRGVRVHPTRRRRALHALSSGSAR